MNIIMYTTHCPRCKVLAAKLAAKGVTYKEETNTEPMLSMGITTVPMLSVDGTLMDFKTANDWINKQE